MLQDALLVVLTSGEVEQRGLETFWPTDMQQLSVVSQMHITCKHTNISKKIVIECHFAPFFKLVQDELRTKIPWGCGIRIEGNNLVEPLWL
jgi:hypothetical protein